MTACRQRAQQDLKLSFILNSIARQEAVEVTEDEVQARVGVIAANYNRPVDRVYEEMEKHGYIETLRDQIREDKVYQVLLSKAAVTEVEKKPEAPAPPAEQPKARKAPAPAADQKPAAAPKAASPAPAASAKADAAPAEPGAAPAKKPRTRKSPGKKKSAADQADDETT